MEAPPKCFVSFGFHRNNYHDAMIHHANSSHPITLHGHHAYEKTPEHVDDPIGRWGRPRLAEACNAAKEYTKVTFFPDFSRFGMTGLDR